MKTFTNPENAPVIGEFTYEGCRYEGIAPGLTFSVLSVGLADFLMNAFPQLRVEDKVAPVAANEYCCSKCGKDCGSKFMKDRHEKVCKEVSVGMATILKPKFIFWNYLGLDKTQLTPDQMIPGDYGTTPSRLPTPTEPVVEKDYGTPAPGKETVGMIGRTMQPVTLDREGVEWYGEGLKDDVVAKPVKQ